MSSQILGVALVRRINLCQITEKQDGASKKVFLKNSIMDGSSCSFFSLFIFLVAPLGTAQILQVLKHCPFGYGKISGGFFLGVP